MSDDLVACHICGTSVKSSEYDRHVDTCASSNVQCPICFGSFDVSAIERHAATCTGVPPPAGAASVAGSGRGRGAGGGGSGGGVATFGRSGGTPCLGGCGAFGLPSSGGLCSACAVSGGAPKRKRKQGSEPTTRQTHNAGHDRRILVRMGDITLEDADAIVNPANEKLDHGSGVAGALREAGGDIVQDTSDIYISEHRTVPTGTAVTLPAGALKCKHLIHAVGPIWDRDDFVKQNDAQRLLGETVIAALTEAEKVGAASVAIPAISSGIFGFPKRTCANILFRSVIHYWCDHADSVVKEVRFTNDDDETVGIFLKQFPKVESALVRTLRLPTGEKVIRCIRGDQAHFFYGQHVKHLCILDATSKTNMSVHHGNHELIDEPLRKKLTSLIEASRKRLGVATAADALTPRSSFVFGSPNLVVVTVPMFDFTEDALKQLRGAIQHGLLRAASQMPNAIEDGKPLGSIAMPPLGARAGFSDTLVAQVVLEEVLTFLQSSASENVREVALCEDYFKQFFVDVVTKGIDADGTIKPLPPIVIPTLANAGAPPPPDETPAQRRERERALAQARLQLELAKQGPIFDSPSS